MQCGYKNPLLRTWSTTLPLESLGTSWATTAAAAVDADDGRCWLHHSLATISSQSRKNLVSFPNFSAYLVELTGQVAAHVMLVYAGGGP